MSTLYFLCGFFNSVTLNTATCTPREVSSFSLRIVFSRRASGVSFLAALAASWALQNIGTKRLLKMLKGIIPQWIIWGLNYCSFHSALTSTTYKRSSKSMTCKLCLTVDCVVSVVHGTAIQLGFANQTFHTGGDSTLSTTDIIKGTITTGSPSSTKQTLRVYKVLPQIHFKCYKYVNSQEKTKW